MKKRIKRKRSRTIETTALCRRLRLDRYNLQWWARQAKVRPCGSRINERNTVVLVWPMEAVRAIRYALRHRRRHHKVTEKAGLL